MEAPTPLKRVQARLRRRRKRLRDRGLKASDESSDPETYRGENQSPSDNVAEVLQNFDDGAEEQEAWQGSDQDLDTQEDHDSNEEMSSVSVEEVPANILQDDDLQVTQGQEDEQEMDADNIERIEGNNAEILQNSEPDVDDPLSPGQEPPDDDPGDEWSDWSSEGSSGENDTVSCTSEWFANQLARVKLQSNISDRAIQKMLNVMLPNLLDINGLLENGHISGSYRHGIKPKGKFNIPKLRCSVKVNKLAPDGSVLEEIFLDDLTVIPSKYLDSRRQRYTLLCQTCYTTLAEIKLHFCKTHPGRTEESIKETFRHGSLAIDGVRECEHGSRSLLVVSVMFDGCVFPWKIYNHLLGVPGAKPDAEELLRPIVDEVNEDPDVCIRLALCDMVERHTMKCMKSHAGHYSCEMCEAPGNGPNGKVDFNYPRSIRFRQRTNIRWRHVARRIRAQRPVAKKGIKGYTPLLDFDYPFDIVNDVPIEPFHLINEGLTKMMMTTILKSQSQASKVIAAKMERVYLDMRVFSDSARRTRKLTSINKFKGSEFGLITFSALPAFLEDCIPSNTQYWRDVKRSLAVYAFLCRAYFYDDETYREVLGLVDTRKCHKIFYRIFADVFCKQERRGVNPNAHAFWHLPEVREHVGPLWKVSTEPLEAFYAKIRRMFQKGTRNVPLQIMQGIYKNDSILHQCRDDFAMAISEDTGASSYCDANLTDLEGNFWQVMEAIGDETFVCARVITSHYHTGVGLGLAAPLPWHKVGVRRYEDVDEGDVKVLRRSEIRGKFMRCGDYVLEWLPQWFRDSKKDY